MQISKKALDEFNRIYEKEFDEDLTDDEANERASRVIQLFKIIAQQLPEEKNTKHER